MPFSSASFRARGLANTLPREEAVGAALAGGGLGCGGDAGGGAGRFTSATSSAGGDV